MKSRFLNYILTVAHKNKCITIKNYLCIAKSNLLPVVCELHCAKHWYVFVSPEKLLNRKPYYLSFTAIYRHNYYLYTIRKPWFKICYVLKAPNSIPIAHGNELNLKYFWLKCNKAKLDMWNILILSILSSIFTVVPQIKHQMNKFTIKRQDRY